MNTTNVLMTFVSLLIGIAIGLFTLWAKSKKWAEERREKSAARDAALIAADRAKTAAEAQAKADAEVRTRMMMFMDRMAPKGQPCLSDKFDALSEQQKRMHKENLEVREADRTAVTTWQREHEAACKDWHTEVVNMFSALKSPTELKPMQVHT